MEKIFVIGEYSKTGKVKVVKTASFICIDEVDWDTEQSINNKVIPKSDSCYREASIYLEQEITTCYYAEKIIAWLKSQKNE